MRAFVCAVSLSLFKKNFKIQFKHFGHDNRRATDELSAIETCLAEDQKQNRTFPASVPFLCWTESVFGGFPSKWCL